MTSAICTPTALSCRCTWAVTNSPMKANCLRSGRTIERLFLSSWSRYGGSSAPAAHTYKKEKQAQTMSRKRHVNYYPLLFLDDANWLLICPCCSSHWRTDWNVLVTRQAAVTSPGKNCCSQTDFYGLKSNGNGTNIIKASWLKQILGNINLHGVNQASSHR